jgi:hypothetical protein
VIAVVIVLGVLVLVLGAWLYGTRSALREARGRGDELATRLEETTHEVEQTMGKLAEAESRVATEGKRADEAVAAAAAAAKEAEKSDAVARAASERALALERATVDAPGLWALEVVRFDRMWRDHSAATPDTLSPLGETLDPARAAIEILTEALREESGTVIDLRWKATTVPGPAPAARLVRACEELLAIARRVDVGVVEVDDDGSGAFVVHVRTEPPLDPPAHVVAALDAAGCAPEVAEGGIEVRISPPAESFDR